VHHHQLDIAVPGTFSAVDGDEEVNPTEVGAYVDFVDGDPLVIVEVGGLVQAVDQRRLEPGLAIVVSPRNGGCLTEVLVGTDRIRQGCVVDRDPALVAEAVVGALARSVIEAGIAT